MSDLFHEAVPDEWIDRAFAIMAMAPQHTFQVLTKRPKRMREYFEGRQDGDPWAEAADAIADMISLKEHPAVLEPRDIPLSNVWLGVTAEDQPRADERIPDLLATPAAVRFVSIEPMLGPVGLKRRKDHGPNESEHWDYLTGAYQHFDGDHYRNGKGQRLDWVICGGESGPGARPSHPDWFRSLRDQCAAASVAFFFKQHGEWIGVPDLRNLPGGSGPGFGAYDHCQHDMQAESVRVGKRRAGWRIGKIRAGRTLDGTEHNGFPEARS